MDDALKAVLDALEPFVRAAQKLPANMEDCDRLYILQWDIEPLDDVTIADLRRLARVTKEYYADTDDYIVIDTRLQPRQEAEARTWRNQWPGKGGGYGRCFEGRAGCCGAVCAGVGYAP